MMIILQRKLLRNSWKVLGCTSRQTNKVRKERKTDAAQKESDKPSDWCSASSGSALSYLE